MGRIAKFDSKAIFQAIGRELAITGKVTTQGIQAATGISAGSLYHRFGSREGMLAEAWVFAVQAFQERVNAGFALGGLEGAVEVALATPRFCREERDLALLLVCGRTSEFLTDDLAPAQRSQLDSVNQAATASFAHLAHQLGKPILDCRMALVAFPLGAVRSFLPSEEVPHAVDQLIDRTARYILGSKC